MVRPAALAATIGALTLPSRLSAQFPDDGFMLPSGLVRVTVDYGRDVWRDYWEGTLRRDNENIGTLRTQSVTTIVGYGLTRRVTVFASLPYVWTNASQGVLQGQRGRQDLSLIAKATAFDLPITSRAARLRLMALGGVATPTSDYSPDFLPLSIGSQSRRAMARATLIAHDTASGLLLEGSSTYTWRGHVTLDRPAYFTNGQLVLSNEVAMPNVVEQSFAVGYQKGAICLPIILQHQRTLGGGDIRRQDMPFVANRMDFTRLHARLMLALPQHTGLTLNLGVMRTLSGRNVGQSSMVSGGFTYAYGVR
jgi:hypothetical protein